METIKTQQEWYDFLYNEWVVNRKSQAVIAKELGIHLGKLEAIISKVGLVGARDKVKYEVNENLFDINLKEFCYFSGLILTDGTINLDSNRVILRIGDIEPLTELSNLYSKTAKIPIFEYNVKGGNTIYDFKITSKYLVEYLNSIGIVAENKTSLVTCPIVNSLENFKYLTRGIIDGDGNIRVFDNKAIFRIYSHSSNFVESFVNEFDKYFNYKLSVNSVKNKTGKEISSRIDFTNNLLFIYEEYKELCIKRKREQLKNLVDDIVHAYEMINHKNW